MLGIEPSVQQEPINDRYPLTTPVPPNTRPHVPPCPTQPHDQAQSVPSREGQASRTTPGQVPIAQLQGYAGGSTVRTCCWSPGLAAGLWRPQAFNILEKLPSAHFLSLRFVLCGWVLIPSVPSSLGGPCKIEGGTDTSLGYQPLGGSHQRPGHLLR